MWKLHNSKTYIALLYFLTGCLGPRLVRMDPRGELFSLPMDPADSQRLWQRLGSDEPSSPSQTAPRIQARQQSSALGSLAALDQGSQHLFATQRFEAGHQIPVRFETTENAQEPQASILQLHIVGHAANSDVFAMYERSSQSPQGNQHTTLWARIPYDQLLSALPLPATHLRDLRLVHLEQGERLENHSTQWQPSWYPLLTGFQDQLPAAMQALEDQKQALKESQERLNQRSTAMTKEREKMAKENAKLRQDLEDLQRKETPPQGATP